MTLSAFIIPVLLICLLLYAWRKKVNAYGAFINGAKGAFDLCLDIFPFLVAIFVAVELFNASGLTDSLSTLLKPVFEFVGIPAELSKLILLRPFSGSASLALVEEIFADYGPDSYIARCASVIMGSSETIFYVATIYFSQTKVKKLLYAIPVALVCTIIGAIVSCLICKII